MEGIYPNIANQFPIRKFESRRVSLLGACMPATVGCSIICRPETPPTNSAPARIKKETLTRGFGGKRQHRHDQTTDGPGPLICTEPVPDCLAKTQQTRRT